MRLAVLADIHGNLPAFEAVLKHIAAQGVDQVIIAGDVVIGSPDSADCWRLAQSLDCPLLRGNHERYLAHFGTHQADPKWSTPFFTPLQWAVEQFKPAERQALLQLPFSLCLPEAPDLLIVHASLRDDHDAIGSHHPPEDQLASMFPDVSEKYIIRAHNHVGQVRIWGQRYIISSSSVGLPLDGNPTAQYLLLEQNKIGWHIQHQSVTYDLQAAIRRYQDTGYLSATGPMGRLFQRELVTATQYLVPFLRLYHQWSPDNSLPLDEAVERFLNWF